MSESLEVEFCRQIGRSLVDETIAGALIVAVVDVDVLLMEENWFG